METFKINVNEAGRDTLETVKGVGPSKAEAIIRDREEQGAFRSIDDLQQRLNIDDEEIGELKKVIEV